MEFTPPKGFRLAGVHAGIKRHPEREDVALVVADAPATAAGVYTTNVVHAAPVALDRQRTPFDNFRVLVINSGNANACTGERGLADAHRMLELAARAVSAEPGQALVMSTGVIGEFLPLAKIECGIAAAAARLGTTSEHLMSAERGIMTTDRGPKLAAASLEVSGRTIHITGMCKGAGMIGPKMATMLGIVMTDACLTPAAAQQALSAAAAESFNCISVEGHMSTNDTLLLLASGAAGGPPLQDAALAAFTSGLTETCIDLAKQIPDDGEGATHLICIEVRGLRTRDEATAIAKTIAHSALVKTAVAGADPNWGRFVSAAGYAGVPFDPKGVDLTVNGQLLYRQGTPAPFDRAAVSALMRKERETKLVLTFREGSAAARFWTSDLTQEYLRINTDYFT